jgi:polar amino acid transport system substrate-binding protein
MRTINRIYNWRWINYKPARNLLFYATILMIWSPSFVRAASLLLVTEERPPRQMKINNKITGIAVDKVKSIMVKAGVDYDLQLLPFSRAFQTAREKANTCIFTIARTPEREKLFKWIDPPLMQIKRTLFARADSNFTIKSLDDARHLTIGTYLGDAMDKYLKKKNMKVDTAPADTNNLDKLLLKRIDLWADDELIGNYAIESREKSAAVKPVFTFMVQDIYLACNPNTDKDIIRRLRKAAQKNK